MIVLNQAIETDNAKKFVHCSGITPDSQDTLLSNKFLSNFELQFSLHSFI